MTDGPTDYPDSWKPRSMKRQTGPSPDVIEALMLAIDSYIASLPPREFDQLVARTRS